MKRELWRIGNFATLDGGGGLEYPARWNTAGRPIVYLAESVAGALVEVLVHLEIDEAEQPESFTLLHVEALNSVRVLDLQPTMSDWRAGIAHTQEIGDSWLADCNSALARVPSAILPYTSNYLLNPRHPDAAQVEIAHSTSHLYDPRLLRIRPAAFSRLPYGRPQ
jgi:RES domain-containing protein